MELVIKHFDELSSEELWEIYKARVAVFVVEQNCPYQEVDEADKVAYHVWLKDDTGIQAYLRVLPAGATFDDPSIGRVISLKRRQGLASQLLAVGIRLAKERFGAKRIVIGAQLYARELYEKAGFVQSSPEYVEDGITHIHMTLE